MKKRVLWCFVIAALAGCGKKAEEVHLVRKKLTSAVYAAGTLVPEQEYKVVSGVDGYLGQALVKEGDRVEKGQLMFVLSSEVRQAQEQGAAAIVEQTVPATVPTAPGFRELRDQIAVAAIRKSQDSLQFARYKRLYEQEAISKSSYERYFLQYQSAQKDYQILRQKLEQQSLNSTLQLQQAKNQLSLARAQNEYGRLRSFASGTVYEVYKKQGDLVAPNQPVALVGSGAMIARLLVDEDDLGKISIGQKVLITMDAYPDKVFKAQVAKIYPLLSKVEQSFRVDAVFDEPIPVGMYGLNLEANIVVAEGKEVNVLPKRALQKGDSVLVERDGKRMMVKIEKGIEDDQFVEIRGGLDSQTKVIIEP